MLFDLGSDPDEFIDLGESPDHIDIRARLYGYLGSWGRRQSQRVTCSAQDLEKMRGSSRTRGVVLGAYDLNDIDARLMSKYVGPAAADYTGDAGDD